MPDEPFFRPGTGPQPPLRPTLFGPQRPAGPLSVSPQPLPEGSEIDRHAQVFAYDPTSGQFKPCEWSAGRLKVTADLSVADIEIGAVEVKDSVTDARLKVNDDQTASVRVVSFGDDVAAYSEANSVAGGAAFDIVSYTVPVGRAFRLRHVVASGSNVSAYWVEINGATLVKKLSYFTDFNVDFFFESDSSSGQKFFGGDVIKVRAAHARPYLGDFNATIFGRLE